MNYLSPLEKSDHTFDCYTQLKPNSRRCAYKTGDYVELKQHHDNKKWLRYMVKEMSQKSVDDVWQILKVQLLELGNQFIQIKEVDSQSWKGTIPIGKALQKK